MVPQKTAIASDLGPLASDEPVASEEQNIPDFVGIKLSWETTYYISIQACHMGKDSSKSHLGRNKAWSAGSFLGHHWLKILPWW